MLYQIKYTVRALLLSTLLILPFASAQAVVLNTWNDADLNASGDFVTVNTGSTLLGFNLDGTSIVQSWFSMQWSAGASNTLGAIGLDTVFYNSSTLVSQVWEGAIGTGTNVTADWSTNFGGSTAGGGFGNFQSLKSNSGGTNAGISSPLFFVLDTTMLPVIYTPNSQGSTFAAHVRYEQSCSGWVSDGRTDGSDVTGNCGSASVPEPGSLALLGMGLFGLGLFRRRKV